MKRRTFLKLAGMGSLSVAAGCTSKPEKYLYSRVHAPDDMVTGKPSWYASTCRECPAGCGIVAKNREGRVIKIEGNPLHPINQGKLCMRGQAALQGIYNPDRIKTPLLRVNDRWEAITFAKARGILKEKGEQAAKKQEIHRVRMLTETVGRHLMDLLTKALDQWWSDGPLVFEPFAYESLKAANEEIFRFKGLPSYHLEKADVLVSFGADFLETWLSPVEYTRKFKAMHALGKKGKGFFIHISPFQSLTGANADLWISCIPGSETALALGLVKQLLERGKGKALPESIRTSISRIAAGYTVESVVRQTGIDPKRYQQVLTALYQADRPLVFGTGATGANNLQTNMGANLLNLVLDPKLSLLDFDARHRVEIADTRADLVAFINRMGDEPADLLLLNNVNPVHALPPESGFADILKKASPFVVCFSSFMDETAALADLVFPVQLPLESWDEYSGKNGMISVLQPAMGRLTDAPHIGDVFLDAAFVKNRPAKDYKSLLFDRLLGHRHFVSKYRLVNTIRQGGEFEPIKSGPSAWHLSHRMTDAFHGISEPPVSQLMFMAVPSIRFFDGRGANRPWLCETPDPLTKIAWQTPVRVHPETLKEQNLSRGDVIGIRSKWGRLEAPIYATENVRPGLLVMDLGQGHTDFGRYAKDMGLNPVPLLSPEVEHVSGAPQLTVVLSNIHPTGQSMALAHTDGSRFQHKRKIALTVDVTALTGEEPHGSIHRSAGLSMNEFPLVLPLADSHDEKRDIYPAHHHDTYRWAMVVDLDRCIGCGACSVACYAENNIGIVGRERILEQREMSWIQIQRYHHPEREEKIIFFPLLCQHCDSAPCESVCPVYASHHSKEGLNNQIYNRCIGTRYCSQNCPYKARRFNWFDWQRPAPLDLQLNPDVTVRSKGVMEKCSFCVQRIKDAHTLAKNEDRKIGDGEIQPACVQTCPTGAFTFGNLLDKESRVRKLADDPRAYQAMGYLNTKPAVIYLKKVIWDI